MVLLSFFHNLDFLLDLKCICIILSVTKTPRVNLSWKKQHALEPNAESARGNLRFCPSFAGPNHEATPLFMIHLPFIFLIKINYYFLNSCHWTLNKFVLRPNDLNLDLKKYIFRIYTRCVNFKPNPKITHRQSKFGTSKYVNQQRVDPPNAHEHFGS